jgi:hypothetical protein
MPATINQVAEGLKTALDTIAGLRCFSYQPEQENPPMAFPILDRVTYHKAFQGGDMVADWTVVVVVGRYLDRTAFKTLDDFLSFSGAKSIRAALEADKTLGGICQTLIVQSSADVTSLSAADAEFLQIRFQVEVHC